MKPQACFDTGDVDKYSDAVIIAALSQSAHIMMDIGFVDVGIGQLAWAGPTTEALTFSQWFLIK